MLGTPAERAALNIARQSRLRARLTEAPFDGVVIASLENILYATGYESVPARLNAHYSMAALITDSDFAIALPSADVAAAISEGIAPEAIEPFGTFYYSGTSVASRMASDAHPDIASALQAILERRPGLRLAVEGSHLSGAARTSISRWSEVVAEAADWMLMVRASKLPAEVAFLRRASELAERGIEAGIEAAAAGVTDREVAACVAATMASGGGMPRNVTVAGGDRSALSDVIATERELCAGDLLRFDVGCVYYGYTSDMGRTAVVGEPSRDQLSRYAALLSGLETEIGAIRPGIAANDLFACAVAAVEDHGLSPYRRHHTGHAIGLAGYEHPVITPRNLDRIERYGTFSLETPFYEPGWGGMIVEDTGVVTDHGFELFTKSDRSLRVIPL